MYSNRTCSMLIAGWCLVFPLTALDAQTSTEAAKLHPGKGGKKAVKKPRLDRWIKKASLIALGQVDRKRSFSYRGVGGGTVVWCYVKVKSVWKGKDSATIIGFWHDLTNHRNEAPYSYPDPQKQKGDIIVLLNKRRIAEGDVWYMAVSRHPPSWLPADSSSAKYIRKKLKSP